MRLVEWEVVCLANVCGLATHALAADARQLLAVCVHGMRENHDVLKVANPLSKSPSKPHVPSKMLFFF